MHKLHFLVLAIFTCSTYAAQQSSPERIRAAIKQSGSPENFLSTIAANTAKMSGQMFDDQTQITGSIANGRTLVYYLRLVNYEKKDIKNLPAFRQKVASMLSPSVCTAPIASILINENDAEYKYMAYSKTREYLFEYSLNKITCSKNFTW